MISTLFAAALAVAPLAPATDGVKTAVEDRLVENGIRLNGMYGSRVFVNGIRLNGMYGSRVFVNGIRLNGMALQGSDAGDAAQPIRVNPFAGLDSAPLGQ